MINRNAKGFTLIELMIVVGIVAILVALALPSFRDVIKKARRADAMNGITNIQLAQERWRVNKPTYGTLADLSIPAASSDGHYTLAVPVNTAVNYTITATPDTAQAIDKCGVFTLTNAAGVITKTVGGSEAASRCWTK